MGRTAREVLNRLKWERGRDLARAEIWVLDRMQPEGGRAVSGGDIVSLGRKTFTTATATIPYYKITRIVYGAEVLFDRLSAAREGSRVP